MQNSDYTVTASLYSSVFCSVDWSNITIHNTLSLSYEGPTCQLTSGSICGQHTATIFLRLVPPHVCMHACYRALAGRRCMLRSLLPTFFTAAQFPSGFLSQKKRQQSLYSRLKTQPRLKKKETQPRSHCYTSSMYVCYINIYT